MVDYRNADVDDIADIQKYFTGCLGLLKNFIGISASIVTASNHTKCVSLNNQQCMTQPTVINLHPNEVALQSIWS